MNFRLDRKNDNINFADRLLARWGLFHLHLGSKIDKKFPERSGNLLILFVDILTSRAYLVTIIDGHRYRYPILLVDPEYLKMLEDNWNKSKTVWGSNLLMLSGYRYLIKLLKGTTIINIVENEKVFSERMGLINDGCCVV